MCDEVNTHLNSLESGYIRLTFLSMYVPTSQIDSQNAHVWQPSATFISDGWIDQCDSLVTNIPDFCVSVWVV